MRIEKKIIFAVTGLLFIFITGLLLFYIKRTHIYTIRALPYSNGVLLLSGIGFASIVTAVVYGFRRKTELLIEKYECRILIITMALLLIYQIIFTYSSYFYTDWDPAGILDAAEKIVTGNREDLSMGYISAHPNNRLLIWIYSLIYGVTYFFTGKCSVMAIVWLQCALTSVCCLLVYIILRLLGNSGTYSFCVFLSSVIFVGMSPWLDVPYSDEAALIFPLLLIYIYAKRKGTLSWMLIGFLTALGYALKPQVVITTAAMIIFSLISRINGSRTREKESNLECIAGFIAAVIVFFLVLYGSIFPSLKLNVDVTQEFGISHYFMMGLNPETDGVYSNPDTEFTASFDNKHDRNLADMDLAKDRLRNYGKRGLVRHLIRKMLVNYGDGSFAWGINGRFFAGRPEDMKSPLTEFFGEFIYDNGKYFEKSIMLAQGIWLLIIFGTIFIFVRIFFKEKESEENYTDILAVISLSLMGITVFELTFEALSRYLFIYLPFYLLMGADGCRSLLRLIRLGSGRFLSERRVP